MTETLYALTVGRGNAGDRFLPDEIHLVTTEKGAEHARLNLLSESPGHFHRLCLDYPSFSLKNIDFTDQNIHVIRREDGSYLDDIRNSNDNDIAADFITSLVRKFTGDDDSALHISIEGGRKTMGYYLGYALSLFGREQDRLSHVLVSEPYENNRDFYYPTPCESVVHVLQGNTDVAYDCRKAKIDLAYIPFVRLRQGLPDKLLAGNASFTRVVAEAQKAMPEISVRFDVKLKSLLFSGERVELPPALLAFYWLLAKKIIDTTGGIHWTQEGLADEFLSLYRRLVSPASGNYERTEKRLAGGMDQKFIEQYKSKINHKILKVLGNLLAPFYLVSQLEVIPGSSYHMVGLDVRSSNIHLPSGL